MSAKPNKPMTTADGAPIADNQNSVTAGPQGPVLMQDVVLLEKMQHFNRERIPERVVHAKGSGAYGTLRITKDISQYSCANLFASVGKETECFLRFSTVAGEKGAADAERDVRGFAVKFYTEEGNWDLVGNNTPVFFIRDPMKFSDFIHSQKRDPKTNMRSSNMQWDFWSHSPESMHQITILFSDRGCPKSLRNINGYGSHTYSLVNSNGEKVWCKFHFKTMQGIENLTNQESARLIGEDRESHQRDLFEAIEQGKFPKWRFCIQVMTEQQADEFAFNPFDVTKVWPHADYPLIEVGELELNRNPENYFAEVEQSSFSPSAIVPGISWSPDKMLQARLMSYADAHRYRVGNNYQQLPVNKPRVEVRNYQRDGAMSFGQGGSTPNYEPNSYDSSPKESPQSGEPSMAIQGLEARRYDHREGNDDYQQAGDLFRLLAEDEQTRLFHNIAEAMQGVDESIRQRQLEHFYKADPAYGEGVAAALESL